MICRVFKINCQFFLYSSRCVVHLLPYFRAAVHKAPEVCLFFHGSKLDDHKILAAAVYRAHYIGRATQSSEGKFETRFTPTHKPSMRLAFCICDWHTAWV